MKLHYRTYGAGPPLVLLHGLFGSLNNWHSHAAVFGEKFHVVALDQRNHGGSPHDPLMTYPAMAADLFEFISDRMMGPINLLGHSMGGRTAMQFALTHPEDVQRLVVVDIRPQGDPPLHANILEAMRDVDFGAVKTREDVDAMLARRIPDQAVRQLLTTNLKRADNGAYSWKINLEAIAAHYADIIGPVTASGQFENPVLFLTGGRSAYIRDTDHPGILAMFPRTRFAEIPHAGHWVHADAPAEFRRIVMDFLSR